MENRVLDFLERTRETERQRNREREREKICWLNPLLPLLILSVYLSFSRSFLCFTHIHKHKHTQTPHKHTHTHTNAHHTSFTPFLAVCMSSVTGLRFISRHLFSPLFLSLIHSLPFSLSLSLSLALSLPPERYFSVPRHHIYVSARELSYIASSLSLFPEALSTNLMPLHENNRRYQICASAKTFPCFPPLPKFMLLNETNLNILPTTKLMSAREESYAFPL